MRAVTVQNRNRIPPDVSRAANSWNGRSSGAIGALAVWLQNVGLMWHITIVPRLGRRNGTHSTSAHVGEAAKAAWIKPTCEYAWGKLPHMRRVLAS